LSSRAGLISLFVVGSTILAFLFLKQKTRLHKIILVVPLLLIVCLTVTNKRFTHFYNNTITHSSQTDNSTNVRLQIWRSALNISQHNLIFGVGAGDIKSELKKEYMISGNEFAEKNNLNVHNQFIETLLGQGLIGLLILIGLLVNAFVESIRKKNYLLFIFLIILVINFLFETLLNTQTGVIFFSFFYCFLMLNANKFNAKSG